MKAAVSCWNILLIKTFDWRDFREETLSDATQPDKFL